MDIPVLSSLHGRVGWGHVEFLDMLFPGGDLGVPAGLSSDDANMRNHLIIENKVLSLGTKYLESTPALQGVVWECQPLPGKVMRSWTGPPERMTPGPMKSWAHPLELELHCFSLAISFVSLRCSQFAKFRTPNTCQTNKRHVFGPPV